MKSSQLKAVLQKINLDYPGFSDKGSKDELIQRILAAADDRASVAGVIKTEVGQTARATAADRRAAALAPAPAPKPATRSQAKAAQAVATGPNQVTIISAAGADTRAKLDVGPAETVGGLKGLIAAHAAFGQLPPAQQRLVYAGQLLSDDSQTLAARPCRLALRLPYAV
jgi:hypothetical protein